MYVDVNECAQSPSVCPVGECVNAVGSYRCVCPSGYRSSNQQTSCQGDASFLFVSFASLTPVMMSRLTASRSVCPSDVDECLTNPCGNGRCDNTPGSYRCVCRLGYKFSSNTCTGKNARECERQHPSNHREKEEFSFNCVCVCAPDVDECDDALQCPGQECINSQGSYRCVSCQPGYRLLNRICTG